MSRSPWTPAPHFSARTPEKEQFAFGSLGGLYTLLAFLPPPGPERDAALELVTARRALFDDVNRVFFGVIPDPKSFASARSLPPGIRWFDDGAGELRRLYRAVSETGAVEPQWVLIDPTLRVLATRRLDQGQAIFDYLARAGSAEAHAGVPMNTPILIVPRVFEPALCRQLIDIYQSQGGQPSGVMREVNGRTVGFLDGFKKRRDTVIEDPDLRRHLMSRISHRLKPEISKAFQFEVTRIERYIVACYDAAEGGHFKAHRDNTSAGTAHRRFAVSINLNSEEFEGGDLRFPEFGRKTYRPPTGGAVVFSCSLLHEATPVTKGVRYAFLPFLHDEAAEVMRAANQHLVVPGLYSEKTDPAVEEMGAG